MQPHCRDMPRGARRASPRSLLRAGLRPRAAAGCAAPGACAARLRHRWPESARPPRAGRRPPPRPPVPLPGAGPERPECAPGPRGPGPRPSLARPHAGPPHAPWLLPLVDAPCPRPLPESRAGATRGTESPHWRREQGSRGSRPRPAWHSPTPCAQARRVSARFASARSRPLARAPSRRHRELPRARRQLFLPAIDFFTFCP